MFCIVLIKISLLFNLLFVWISLVAHFYLATCVYQILFFVWLTLYWQLYGTLFSL